MFSTRRISGRHKASHFQRARGGGGGGAGLVVKIRMDFPSMFRVTTGAGEEDSRGHRQRN
jgi:hypothetical protein